MKKYLLKRVGFILLALQIVSLIVFGMTQLLPGNVTQFILGRQATEERQAVLEAKLGLDDPWYVQYFDWWSGFVTGDWGTSLRGGSEVFDLVMTAAAHSFQLALVTLLAVTLISIPLGVVGAVNHGGFLDRLVLVGSYLGISIPTYVSGTLLLLLFGGPIFGIFPSGGYVPLSEGIVPWLSYLVLPAVALVILLTAHMMGLTRGEMIETIQSDYVRTARIKGLPERTVLFKHALKNSLLPTITLLALDLGYLMGGIVVIEEIFAYPGLGKLVVDSILERDLPVIQASMLLIASVFMTANFAADVVYTYLNPRIEYE